MINKESFLVRYKELPNAGVSPYVPQSYEAIDKTWALELHSKAKVTYGNLVANVEGKNITFMKNVDTDKDLYLLDCITLQGSSFKTDTGIACINAETMKVMIGNLPAAGLPPTTDASSLALINRFKASITIAADHERGTGYVRKNANNVLEWFELPKA